LDKNKNMRRFLQRGIYGVNDRYNYGNRDISFLLWIFVGFQKCEINLRVKERFSFMLSYKKPLKEEQFSSFKGFFVLIKIQKKLELYESMFRDAKVYIPDIL
jgi:hypothetical protein